MEERLQKYMARCGIASRRKCEEIILDGKIKVNGTVITEVGTKIDPEKDIVEYNNNIIKVEEKKVYIMLNKPEGYITSVKDEKGRKTVLDIVNVEERIYPIGRLDYDSSGLLLLTNDGSIYNNIIHPRVSIKKNYIIFHLNLRTKKSIIILHNFVNEFSLPFFLITTRFLRRKFYRSDLKVYFPPNVRHF